MKTTLRKRVVQSVTAAVVLFGVSVFGYVWIENIPSWNVLFDNDKAVIERCEQLNQIRIVGDETVEETLRTAGVGRSQGLVAALKSDSEM